MSQYEIQRLDGLVESPFTSDELRDMASTGNLNSRDRIRRIGDSSWYDARTVPSLAPLLLDTSGGEDDASSSGSEELAITGSHAGEMDFAPTFETETGPSLESMLDDLTEDEPIEDLAAEEEETDEGLVSDDEEKPSFESSSGDSGFTPSFETEPEPSPESMLDDLSEKNLVGDLVDIDSEESEPEIASEEEADDDADEPADSSSSSEYAFPSAETDTSDEEENPISSISGETMPTSSPEDGDEAVPFIREFMGTTAPSTTPEEPKKELNAMNTGLSSRTQNALYLILGGLMARPLMDALSSLMGAESQIGGFLQQIGNLGAIGLTGLGVIVLLSDCLTSRSEETGSEAAMSMLLRVAMVFVIVIMLVVLMQLVGEVKLPGEATSP